jgi:hypothetical protein
MCTEVVCAEGLGDVAYLVCCFLFLSHTIHAALRSPTGFLQTADRGLVSSIHHTEVSFSLCFFTGFSQAPHERARFLCSMRTHIQ